jgi:NADH-quinone oxidoreductase subunit L
LLSYLLIFTFLMLVYVTADNLLQAFVGWEGVGLSSFILINFWYTRCQAVRSAIKALILNRIGDFGLCLAIGWIYLIFGSLDFATISLLAPTLLDNSFIWMEWHIGSLNIIGCALSFAWYSLLVCFELLLYSLLQGLIGQWYDALLELMFND